MCLKCPWSRRKNPVPDLTGCGVPLGEQVSNSVRITEHIHRRLFNDFEQWACGNCYKKGDIKDIPSTKGIGPDFSTTDDFDWMNLWAPTWECDNCKHRVCSQPHHCVMRNTKCETNFDVLFWVNENTDPESGVQWRWYKDGSDWKIHHEDETTNRKRTTVREWLQKT